MATPCPECQASVAQATTLRDRRLAEAVEDLAKITAQLREHHQATDFAAALSAVPEEPNVEWTQDALEDTAGHMADGFQSGAIDAIKSFETITEDYLMALKEAELCKRYRIHWLRC